jgi:hypothetical protein
VHRLLTVAVAAGLVACFGVIAPAAAHHGWGGYRTDIEIELTVSELKLGNPHDRLIAVDADGASWNLLLAPPARNRRFGFNEDTLAVGDEIKLFGQRHASRNEIKVHCIFRDGEAVYTYRYGKGTSSLARHGRAERC